MTRADTSGTAPRYLVRPPDLCRSCPPDPVWVGAFTVAVGEYHVGLYADSEEVLRTLRSVFSAWVVDVAEPPEGFGISVERRGGSGPRLLPELLHGRFSMIRSRSMPRVLRRLDLALGQLANPVPVDALRSRQLAAVVREGAAVVVPASFANRSTGIERAIGAEGGSIVEPIGMLLDLQAEEIVALPGLIGPAGVPDLEDALASAPGRYPIKAVLWSADEVVEGERAATGVARLYQLLDRSGPMDRQKVLEDLAALSPRFAPTFLPSSGVDTTAVFEALS